MPNIESLADILRQRNIKEIKYFHTDHFEPWSKSIQDDSCRAVERFLEQSNKFKFASKQSLFYLSYLPAALKQGANQDGFSIENDGVIFLNRKPELVKRAREVLMPLESDNGHEFHMHIHHERWTQNSGLYDPLVHKWVNENSSAELDSERMNLAIFSCLRVAADWPMAVNSCASDSMPITTISRPLRRAVIDCMYCSRISAWLIP